MCKPIKCISSEWGIFFINYLFLSIQRKSNPSHSPTPLHQNFFSDFQQRPRQIIHGREDEGMFQELVPGLHHIVDVRGDLRRNVVHVQALVALRAVLE